MWCYFDSSRLSTSSAEIVSTFSPGTWHAPCSSHVTDGLLTAGTAFTSAAECGRTVPPGTWHASSHKPADYVHGQSVTNSFLIPKMPAAIVNLEAQLWPLGGHRRCDVMSEAGSSPAMKAKTGSDHSAARVTSSTRTPAPMSSHEPTQQTAPKSPCSSGHPGRTGTALRLVFYTEERGLPSLQRGWRTPDPSPTRSGLPKCAAPQVGILEGDAAALAPRDARLCDEGNAPFGPARNRADGFENIASRGSAGHPHGCASACKFFKRGCKEGANCDHCHLCVWIRPRIKASRQQRSEAVPHLNLE